MVSQNPARRIMAPTVRISNGVPRITVTPEGRKDRQRGQADGQCQGAGQRDGGTKAPQLRRHRQSRPES